MPDLSSMAASVGALLKESDQTLAVSESSCGGLLSACLVVIPGASAYYRGGAWFTLASLSEACFKSPTPR